MSIVVLLVGIVIGVILAAIVGVRLMRSKMLVPLRSKSSFEDTCAAIERELDAAEGWTFPMEPFDKIDTLFNRFEHFPVAGNDVFYFHCYLTSNLRQGFDAG